MAQNPQVISKNVIRIIHNRFSIDVSKNKYYRIFKVIYLDPFETPQREIYSKMFLGKEYFTHLPPGSSKDSYEVHRVKNSPGGHRPL